MKLANALRASVLGISLVVLPVGWVNAEQSSASPVPTQQASQKININTADAATLAGSLRGVGVKKAEAIVAYRSEHGPFKSVDELVNVKGIGEKMLEQLRPLVAI